MNAPWVWPATALVLLKAPIWDEAERVSEDHAGLLHDHTAGNIQTLQELCGLQPGPSAGDSGSRHKPVGLQDVKNF